MPLLLNPWKSIWTSPSHTFHALLEQAPGYNVLTLAMLMGLGSALGQLSGSGIAPLTALALTLLLGPLLGLAELFLGSWILATIGKWLGGTGEPVAIRTIMAWAGVPNVLALLTWLLMLWVAGDTLFMARSEPVMQQLASNTPFVIIASLQMLLGFWSISLLVLGLAVAHRLALGKALLTLLFGVMVATLLLLPLKLLWEQWG